jgi:hypothetical protein
MGLSWPIRTAAAGGCAPQHDQGAMWARLVKQKTLESSIIIAHHHIIGNPKTTEYRLVESTSVDAAAPLCPRRCTCTCPGTAAPAPAQAPLHCAAYTVPRCAGGPSVPQPTASGTVQLMRPAALA